jgi:hypothetical protein
LDIEYPEERGDRIDWSVETIKRWVDYYRAQNNGKFPSSESGKVKNADDTNAGVTWKAINLVLRRNSHRLTHQAKSLPEFLDIEYPDQRVKKS